MNDSSQPPKKKSTSGRWVGAAGAAVAVAIYMSVFRVCEQQNQRQRTETTTETTMREGRQKEAYVKAVRMEQGPFGDPSPWAILEYQRVIQMDPASQWAEKAQRRIDVIQQNINADRAIQEQRRNAILFGSPP
jgi:hypothetical protein